MNISPKVKHNLNLLKKMLLLFSPYKYSVIIALLATLIVAASTGGIAYIIKPALDEIFIKQDERMLMFIPLAFFILTLLKGVGRYLQNYFMTLAGLRVIEDLRSMIYNKLISLPTSYYEEESIGNMMSRVMNDVGSMRASVPSLIMIVRQIVTIISLIGVVIYQNAFLAIFALVILPVAFYPLVIFSKHIRRYANKGLNISGEITSQLQESFAGIRVIKAFSTEEVEAKRFTSSNNFLINLSLKQSKISELASPLMELIGSIGIGTILFIGGYQVLNGEMTTGTFFSFLASVSFMYEPVKSIMMYNNSIQAAFVSADRIYGLLDSHEDVEEKGGDLELLPPIRSIKFVSVFKKYKENSGFALEDVSFEVFGGERIALVGPSGAGKTTIVNLIPQFYKQTSGAIYINGENIEKYSLISLRKNIGTVAQSAFLFNRTILENIAYGVEGEIDFDRVIEVSKAAYIYDFIESLPDGFNSNVGDTGAKLSGGQRQRITIARALFKNAPLLILDEATSALDTESEQIVQRALENLMKKRTSIVIAHRLSTVLAADRIIVMNKGKIDAIGTHSELLNISPLYEKLYTLQFADGEFL